MSQFFSWGGQSIGASASAPVLPVYSGLIFFRMDWLDLLAVQGTLKRLLQHQSSKVSILWHSGFFVVQLSHPYMTTGKTIVLAIWDFVGKVMPMLFNTLFKFDITSLSRRKNLLILWLQSLSTVILEPTKIKSDTVSTFSPSICHGTGCHDLHFLILSCKLDFSVSSFTFIKRLFNSSSFLTLKWYHLHIWGCCYFPWQSWLSLWFVQPSTSHHVLCIWVK